MTQNVRRVSPKLKLYDQKWDESVHKTEASLTAGLNVKNAETISYVVSAAMSETYNAFPLLQMTEGAKNYEYTRLKEGHTLEGVDEYQYPVIDNLDKVEALVDAVSGSTPGKGFTEFEMKFPQRRFGIGYTLIGANGQRVYITGEPTDNGDGWIYPVKLDTTDSADYLRASASVAGARWARGWYGVESGGSYGSESFYTEPYMVQNQINHIRKSYSWDGDVPGKVMIFEIKTRDGKTYKKHVEWQKWQYLWQLQEETENMLIHSRFNKDEKGRIRRAGRSGNPVKEGAGLIDQIVNKDSYTTLTEARIKTLINDIFYGTAKGKGSKKKITILTGTGGSEDFHTAMENKMAANQFIQLKDPYVTGDEWNLTYGAYFTRYRHLNTGNIVEVRYSPYFDKGAQAEVAPKHPRTGYSLESHRMLFVDTSDYDGKNNLVMIKKKGMELRHDVIAGVGSYPDVADNAPRSSDKHAISYEWMKACGILLRDATFSFDLQCVSGL